MTMKNTFLLVMALLPGAALAEPLNYDYIYLSNSETETDGGGESEGDAFGGFWSFADTLHVFASWDDSGSYAGANPAWDYDLKTLRAGIGGHYLIGERTMIAPAVAVIRAEGDVMAASWTSPRELKDTGYGVQLDLRHAVSDWFELTAGGRYSDVLDNSSTELVGGLVFHPTDWLALGALYHEREEAASTELTVRWYF